MSNNLFLPAEWYPQSGVQLTWPHADTDWAYMLDEVEACFIEIACAIAERELLLVVAPDIEHVKSLLKEVANNQNIRYFECATNDTWARDHGAITLIKEGKPQLLDFTFNGWGLKFASNYDNLITSKLFQANQFNKEVEYVNKLNFILEGGSIESDGKGTILTTSECLLSPNRNGESSKIEIENYLKSVFNAEKILWLNHGYLAGDDTDSHVDTLARLCPNNIITYVKCDDQSDEHYIALKEMENELHQLKTASGVHFQLIPLPMADAIEFDGERLPATYANFLIINGAVLVPVYNQPHNDFLACEAIQKAFPEYEIVPINCVPLIKQHGSLHCVTMQFPEGVLK